MRVTYFFCCCSFRFWKIKSLFRLNKKKKSPIELTVTWLIWLTHSDAHVTNRRIKKTITKFYFYFLNLTKMVQIMLLNQLNSLCAVEIASRHMFWHLMLMNKWCPLCKLTRIIWLSSTAMQLYRIRKWSNCCCIVHCNANWYARQRRLCAWNRWICINLHFKVTH